MKRKIALALMVCMLSSTTAFAGVDTAKTSTIKDAQSVAYEDTISTQYALKDAGKYDTFYNYVDGYSFDVVKGLTVDMSMSEVGTVLEKDGLRIEVYKQPIEKGKGTGYINYSNRFLKNTKDHFVEFNGQQTFNGRTAKVLAWHRDELKGVAQDKEHYLVLDFILGEYCYTIHVKGNEPLGMLGGYTHMVKTFRTFEPTAEAYMRQAQPVNLETKNWNKETKDFYKKYLSDDAELNWGIFETDFSWGFKYDTIDRYEKHFEYEFPVLLVYTDFANKTKYPKLKEHLETGYKKGRVLELTLQTTWQVDGSNMVYDVLDGEYDAFLADYAKTIADFDHPVLFRLGNEMNGDWCPYSSYNTSRDTMIYKEFYKYVRSFFDKAQADNVIWVWNPNHASFPNYKWHDAMMYYPGDEYVDVVGLTAYNTGTYYASTGETWQDFKTIYDSFYYDYCRKFAQPLIITEFASASVGGDKNQWIIDMFETIDEYDRIKLAIWWDGCDWDAQGNIARSYFIDETPEIMDTFKKYLSDK